MGGAALLLAIGQVANLLGINDKGTGHQHVLYRLWLTLTKGDPFNTQAIAISATTITVALLLRRLVRRYRLPQMDMLAALVFVASLAFLFGWTQPDVSGKTIVAIAGTVPASTGKIRQRDWRSPPPGIGDYSRVFDLYGWLSIWRSPAPPANPKRQSPKHSTKVPGSRRS